LAIVTFRRASAFGAVTIAPGENYFRYAVISRAVIRVRALRGFTGAGFAGWSRYQDIKKTLYLIPSAL
jgi:hypothetical protein